MRNYLKKLMIMFVMAFSIIGIGIIQNEVIANAATIGDQLISPEAGWQRYDDENTNIVYTPESSWGCDSRSLSRTYQGTFRYNCGVVGASIRFKFYGTQLRLLTWKDPDQSGANVKIDGVNYGNFSNCSTAQGGGGSCIFFEKLNLTKAPHEVVITTIGAGAIQGARNTFFSLDAIDIDAGGRLIPTTESITLNKSSIELIEGTSEQLTATVTPAGQLIIWESSDPSIATVGSMTGKVTAIKEGQATITATTSDGTYLSDSCVVNVKQKPVITTSSAVSIGEQSTLPEDGWKRYDDNNSMINYNSDWTLKSADTSYAGTRHVSNQNTTKQVQFGFTGSKLRIIGTEASNRSKTIKIEIDGKVSTFSMYKDTTSVYPQALCYEVTGLSEGEHNVKIYDTTTSFVDIDAIDVDSLGKLVSYNGSVNPQNNVITVEISKLQSEIDSIQELVTVLQNKLNSMQNEINTAKTKTVS